MNSSLSAGSVAGAPPAEPAGAAGRQNPLATLRRLARKRVGVEQCDFCSLPLAPGHRHLLELATRKLICACDACALRFDNGQGRYRLVPRDSKALQSFQI